MKMHKKTKIIFSVLFLLIISQSIYIIISKYDKQMRLHDELLLLKEINESNYLFATKNFKGGDFYKNEWSNEYSRFALLSKNLEGGFKDSLMSFKQFAIGYLSDHKDFIEKLDYPEHTDYINQIKIELIKCGIIQAMIIKRMGSFVLIDACSVIPYTRNDTIYYGTEYNASIFFIGRNRGAHHFAVMKTGDTLKTNDYDKIYPVYSEIPNKRGYIEREGEYFYFHNGKYQSIDFKIEYYVK